MLLVEPALYSAMPLETMASTLATVAIEKREVILSRVNAVASSVRCHDLPGIVLFFGTSQYHRMTVVLSTRRQFQYVAVFHFPIIAARIGYRGNESGGKELYTF